MKKFKQKLAELNNAHNSNKRKSSSNAILLFIAQATAETNSNVKWLIWMMGLAAAAAIAILIKLAFG